MTDTRITPEQDIATAELALRKAAEIGEILGGYEDMTSRERDVMQRERDGILLAAQASALIAIAKLLSRTDVIVNPPVRS